MSIDLTSHYLGMELANPLVVSASPLSERIDRLVALEQAGAAAAVLPSLFEEQIRHEEQEVLRLHQFGSESFAEALDYFPVLDEYNTGPDSYLRHVESAKRAVKMPIIGSLNGSTTGGWTGYARRIADAGADALELNIYVVPADVDKSADEVEAVYLELVREVRGAVAIPLAVKICPYFSAPANMARRLADAGADGLVLFNRLVHPDIDLETRSMSSKLELSRSAELHLPLAWIGILRGRVGLSLAATSGVHTVADVLKLLFAGADAVLLASVLMKNGPEYLATLLTGLCDWLAGHEYASVEQMKGSLSQLNCPTPEAYERVNYMKALVTYSGPFV